MNRLAGYFRVIIPIAYLIGIVGISIKINNPQYFKVTSIFVPVSFLILMLFHKPHSLRFWITLASIGLLGFLVRLLELTRSDFWPIHVWQSFRFGVFGTPLNMAIN